ncbi:MAG: DUF2273 domain-containing protein [Limnochordales bacterium]|nr:MAG: hypothetical protein DIU83_04890 [Bacillota bacterium]
MTTDREGLLAAFLEHKGKIVGAVFGLILGWLVIRYGFWRGMLAAAFVAAGFFIGALVDREGWDGLYDILVRRRR